MLTLTFTLPSLLSVTYCVVVATVGAAEALTAKHTTNVKANAKAAILLNVLLKLTVDKQFYFHILINIHLHPH